MNLLVYIGSMKHIVEAGDFQVFYIVILWLITLLTVAQVTEK
jgi:hypothetical protein